MNVINLYHQISSFVPSIPKHNVKNIGEDETYKYCLHNSLNRNEEYLRDFLHENRLTCLEIKFLKMEGNYGPTLTQIMLKHRYIIYS